MTEPPDSDLAAIGKLAETYESLSTELGKVIVGQDKVVEELLVAMFSGGHVLLVGVPGLAKTLMIRTLADALSLQFSRIQFTPDLMPSDITGTEVIQQDPSTGERVFRFLPGPVFANIVLADEINRTPPKTQAALLEAMQEHQVSAAGKRHVLPEPFFVLATQNPIEQEGTYPLPEAQLDRFMFNVFVDYPEKDEELEIVRRTTADVHTKVTATLGAEAIANLSQVVRKLPIADAVSEYAIALVRKTRVGRPEAADICDDLVLYGAGPRASQYLVLGGKARAALRGRHYVSPEDIRAVAHPVLRHRIRLNYQADAQGMTTDKLIDELLETTDLPSGEATTANVPEVFRSADDR
jgi:MoxR-like ATPase